MKYFYIIKERIYLINKRLQKTFISFINLIFKMSTTIECPICMDDIDITKNCITTECGHCFHASCVMRNVAQNGFACPMCRTAMAEEPDDDESDCSAHFSLVNERNPDDYALRGFRMFMDNLEGVAHDHEDELEEQEDEEEPSKPSPAYIAQRLVEQGTTMEDLVKILLRDHQEYDDEDEEFDIVDERVWGEMRILIDNHQPQNIQPQEEPTTPIVEPIAIVTTPLSEQAEDKPPANIVMRQRRHGIAHHLDNVSRALFADEIEE